MAPSSSLAPCRRASQDRPVGKRANLATALASQTTYGRHTRGERSELRDHPAAKARRAFRLGDTTAGYVAGGGLGGWCVPPRQAARRGRGVWGLVFTPQK